MVNIKCLKLKSIIDKILISQKINKNNYEIEADTIKYSTFIDKIYLFMKS